MRLADIDLLKIGNTIHMAGVIYSGEGKTLLCHFPEARIDPHTPTSVEHLDMSQDDWMAFLEQADTLKTEVTARAQDGTLQKAFLRKSQRLIETAVQWRVFRRDKYACRYCGKDDVPLTVDHLILWEEGGPSTEVIMVAACRKCNKARGNTAYAAWLASPYYHRVSTALPVEVLRANREIAATLAAIPRQVHVRTR